MDPSQSDHPKWVPGGSRVDGPRFFCVPLSPKALVGEVMGYVCVDLLSFLVCYQMFLRDPKMSPLRVTSTDDVTLRMAEGSLTMPVSPEYPQGHLSMTSKSHQMPQGYEDGSDAAPRGVA